MRAWKFKRIALYGAPSSFEAGVILRVLPLPVLLIAIAGLAGIALAAHTATVTVNTTATTTGDTAVYNITIINNGADNITQIIVNYTDFASATAPSSISCGPFIYNAGGTNIINCTNSTPAGLASGEVINMTFSKAAPTAANTTPGQYFYRVATTDNSSATVTNLLNVSVTDNDVPSVYLSSPANSATSAANVTFQYTVTDNSNMYGSCYVYGNFTGAWARNQTNQTAIGSGTNSINVTLADGTYIWNVNCSDPSGNIAFNATNRTLTVDATPPGITASGPTVTQTSGSVTLTATTNESATCKFDTTYTTNYSAMSSTFSTTGSTSHSQALSLSNGNYVYYALCIDSVSNAMTVTTNISFTVSITATGGSSSGGSGGTSAGGTVVSRLDDKGEVYSTSVRESNSVSYYFGGENHTIKVTDVLNDSVILTISSTPYNITLAIGETRNVDMNGDGTNDLAIKFTGISGGINANLEFTKLAQPVTPPGTALPSTTPPANETQNTTAAGQKQVPINTTTSAIVIIIGAAVLVVAWWWLQEKPEPYHYRHKKD
jgi:uncharacterized repeat protein (TIGR01451 family)